MLFFDYYFVVWGVITMFQKRGDKALSDVELKLKLSFVKIKSEIDDHRQSINENTNEIQGNYEYLCKLDSKLDKLSQTVEQLSLVMDQLMRNRIDTHIHTVHVAGFDQAELQQLTEDEQEF